MTEPTSFSATQSTQNNQPAIHSPDNNLKPNTGRTASSKYPHSAAHQLKAPQPITTLQSAIQHLAIYSVICSTAHFNSVLKVLLLQQYNHQRNFELLSPITVGWSFRLATASNSQQKDKQPHS
ncbi:hypothetical protein Nepgr_005375 [Nepenthes gracilis]|uniref:Uncharacterized protein n=1 Tax=Nepenthes gracilis TaxID=150966 RepID=A0AAD3S375_NEPGR|nr:hypothetical protein Nepgr_005375 [Nepenthes gracilis]